MEKKKLNKLSLGKEAISHLGRRTQEKIWGGSGMEASCRDTECGPECETGNEPATTLYLTCPPETEGFHSACGDTCSRTCMSFGGGGSGCDCGTTLYC